MEYKWSDVYENPDNYLFDKLIRLDDLNLEKFKKLVKIYEIADDDMLWTDIIDINPKIVSKQFIKYFKDKKLDWHRLFKDNFIDKDFFIKNISFFKEYSDLMEYASMKKWFDIEMINKYMSEYLSWGHIFFDGRIDIEYLQNNPKFTKKILEFDDIYQNLSYIKNITIPFILSFGEDKLVLFDWEYILRNSNYIQSFKYLKHVKQFEYHNKNNISCNDLMKLPHEFVVYMFVHGIFEMMEHKDFYKFLVV